jgi:hypothetical protein
MRSRNDVIAFRRVCEHQPRLCDWRGRGALLLSTYLDEEQKDLTGPTLLRPDEGIIVKLRT